MKRLLVFILLHLFVFANAQEITCRYGFTYEISNSPNWGKDKPVITSVYPNTPADRAGLKPFDIIEEVDGKPITENELDDIHLFLNPEGVEIVELTIKNIDKGTHKVKVKKECKSMLTLSESQLATAFFMYAVEDTHERLFLCPFVTTQTKEPVDFSVFKSFDFVDKNENQPELAKKINALINKELLKKGLNYDPVKPDIYIHVYFSYGKNPNFKPRMTKNDELSPTYRYDIPRDRMSKLPFLPPGTIETEAEFILKLGFRLEDTKGRILWECEANEMLFEAFSIEDFASIHIPLMCMQYPYVKYGRNVQFRLSKKKYNYTGINFSINTISEVASVDPFSPAANAGILPFDRLEAINGKQMNQTSSHFTAAYRRFIVNTLKFRDINTRFTDANGFADCMYWDVFKYPQIVKAFNTKKNYTAFSYLFNFAPFINLSGNNACDIKLKRNTEKLEFAIRPEIRYEIMIVVD